MDIIKLKKDFDQLVDLFRNFQLIKNPSENYIVKGNLGFKVEYNGNITKDDYDIEMVIPDDYPSSPPSVKEIKKKIIRTPNNHINDDGTFCLGSPIAVKRTFAQRRTLLWFTKEQVVRFLFNHSYKRDHGIRPDGELLHGPDGLLEYYREIFDIQDDFIILKFLQLLGSGQFYDQIMCPCESGRKIRKCHYRIIKKLRNIYSPEDFQSELAYILFR